MSNCFTLQIYLESPQQKVCQVNQRRNGDSKTKLELGGVESVYVHLQNPTNIFLFIITSGLSSKLAFTTGFER